MKTSNKLLIAAIILVLVSLTAYNIQLVKAYHARSDVYYNYHKIELEDFSKINIQAGYVQIKQGPFAVYSSKASNGIVNISLKDNELIIEKNDLFDRRIVHDKYDLIISCPDLEQVKMDARILKDGKKVSMLSGYISDDYNANMVDISGFELDSLMILQDNSNLVNLTNNRIKNLKAELGESKGAGSMLRLDSTNHIQQAEIDVREAGRLILDNIYIERVNGNFSSTSKVSISGNSMKMLKLLN
jgi:hypothetical protein